MNARVAQLVEHDLAKVGVAGPNPVSRFFKTKCYFSNWKFLNLFQNISQVYLVVHRKI